MPACFPHEPEARARLARLFLTRAGSPGPKIGLRPKFCKNPTRRFSSRARLARLFPTRAGSPGPKTGLSPKFCENPTRRFSARALLARQFPTRARSPGPKIGLSPAFANPCSERLEHITLGFNFSKKSEVKKIYDKNKSGV